MSKAPDRHPDAIEQVELGGAPLSVRELVAVARYRAKVSFSADYYSRVDASRIQVERFLSENRLVYGVTTGFGENVNKPISPNDADQLQLNIVRSHAVSVGEPLCREIVRAIQLMVLNSLGRGYSGVRRDVLDLIAALLNHDIDRKSVV